MFPNRKSQARRSPRREGGREGPPPQRGQEPTEIRDRHALSRTSPCADRPPTPTLPHKGGGGPTTPSPLGRCSRQARGARTATPRGRREPDNAPSPLVGEGWGGGSSGWRAEE